MIEVEMRNETLRFQGGKGGTYLLKGTTNGRSYWVDDSGTIAVWYYNNNWIIGPVTYLGTDQGGIATADDLGTLCPHDKRHTFRYMQKSNGPPVNTQDVKVSCVIKGRIPEI